MDLQEKIGSYANDLIEHGEAVVILVSTVEGEFDNILYAYRGSYYTALGMMEDFKLKKSLEHLHKTNE